MKCPDFIILLQKNNAIGIEITAAVEQTKRMAETAGKLPGLFIAPFIECPISSKEQTRHEAENFAKTANQTIEEQRKADPNKPIGIDLSASLQLAARILCRAIGEKMPKTEKYLKCKENWLLVYDSAQAACGAGLGYRNMIAHIIAAARISGLQPLAAFDRIIILNRECLIFNGGWDNSAIYSAGSP